MRTRYSRTLRIISAVTLAFFSWTFLSLWEIPAALAAEKQKAAAKGQSTGKPAGRELRSEEKFEGVLTGLREEVNKAGEKNAKGEDDSAEMNAIRAKKTELDGLAKEIRAELASTEKTLKDKGLPKEILNRHYRFSRNFEDNLQILKANLADAEAAKTSTDRKAKIEKIRLHLAKVKKPSTHQKLDPNRLPFSSRKAGKAREPRLDKKSFERDFPQQKAQNKRKLADSLLMPDLLASKPQPKPVLLAFNEIASDVPFSLAIDSNPQWNAPQFAFSDARPLLLAQAASQPTADDLAEAPPTIQFTPAIRAKAQDELSCNPTKIFNWVRSNIFYEPYYGSFKSANQTLLEGAGNDFDQAGLLISLMRVCNIAAKYAYGTVEIPAEKAANMVGVADPKAAATILATQGVPVKTVVSGGTVKAIQMERAWVEAFIDYFPSWGRTA